MCFYLVINKELNNNNNNNNIIITIIIIMILRSRFLGGKDNFLKCLKQLLFGIVYSQKFPIIASIIIYKNDWPKKIKT